MPQASLENAEGADEEDDGEWEPPTIPNPAYKGEWKPKLIDNPAYKGVSIDYFHANNIGTFADFQSAAIMQANSPSRQARYRVYRLFDWPLPRASRKGKGALNQASGHIV